MACVRYWAGARAIAGTQQETIAAASLVELVAAVTDAHGDRMARVIKTGLVLVDGERVSPTADRLLTGSTLVEVLPPYAGG